MSNPHLTTELMLRALGNGSQSVTLSSRVALEAADEIATLRSQLAEARKENREWKKLFCDVLAGFPPEMRREALRSIPTTTPAQGDGSAGGIGGR